MTEPIEDLSMLLWSAAGREIATRDIALALAEMVFKEVYGEEDFEGQLPLHVSETPDRWIVKGSRIYDYSKPVNDLVHGKVEIEILKANCRIMKLVQPVDFAMPDEWK